jgi:hypothetical protein
MALKRDRKRKAWVIVLDSANPAAHEEILARAEVGQPLAALPPRTSIDKVLAVVDALVQVYLWRDAEDRMRFLKPVEPRKPETAYGRAQKHDWGQQVMGGFNPYIEAFRVDDLRLVTDIETGQTSFEYTRRPAFVPPHIG